MAKRTKRSLPSYLNLAINLEATDGLPAGQLTVAYITQDRKLCVQFPNGGQEIHSVKKLDGFAGRHGGWVEAAEPSKWLAYHGKYNPLHSDLGSNLDQLVDYCLECGMTPSEAKEAILKQLDEKFANLKK